MDDEFVPMVCCRLQCTIVHASYRIHVRSRVDEEVHYLPLLPGGSLMVVEDGEERRQTLAVEGHCVGVMRNEQSDHLAVVTLYSEVKRCAALILRLSVSLVGE